MDELANMLLALAVLFLGIGLFLLPGLIATQREHQYKGVIWALTIAGLITVGFCWVIALVWALWPTEKSLIDPVLGNVTGSGVRNAGDTMGSVGIGIHEGGASEAEIRRLLAVAKNLRDSGDITEEEFTNRREKILDLG